jgi:hypothetical protein
MSPPLSLVVGVVAALLLLPILDRLRVMSWRTHMHRVVILHFVLALWLGCAAFDAFFYGQVSWYEAASICPAGLWLASTWRDWRTGPPAECCSRPMPLDGIPSRTHR